MAASENEFEAFLQSINLAVEYFERFKETGFDDIDLIKSLEPGELQNMFDMVGLSAKPGHVLKFKKAIAQLTAPTPQRTGNVDQSYVPQKRVQKSKFLTMHIIKLLHYDDYLLRDNPGKVFLQIMTGDGKYILQNHSEKYHMTCCLQNKLVYLEYSNDCILSFDVYVFQYLKDMNKTSPCFFCKGRPEGRPLPLD